MHAISQLYLQLLVLSAETSSLIAHGMTFFTLDKVSKNIVHAEFKLFQLMGDFPLFER